MPKLAYISLDVLENAAIYGYFSQKCLDLSILAHICLHLLLFPCIAHIWQYLLIFVISTQNPGISQYLSALLVFTNTCSFVALNANVC